MIVRFTQRNRSIRKLPADQVWKRPQRPGYGEMLRGLGGVASPLLAGFSLAAIAQLLTATDPPPLADWAVLAFASAVGLLVYAMQISFHALGLDPSPASQLNWRPTAQVTEAALAQARSDQAHLYEQMVGYWRNALRAYDMGLVAFLSGLVLLLIPDHWTAARIAAIALAGAFVVLEAWWTIANFLYNKRFLGKDDFGKWVHPVVYEPPVEVEPLESTRMADVLDSDRREAAGLPRGPRPAANIGGLAAGMLVAGAVASGVVLRLLTPGARRHGGGG